MQVQVLAVNAAAIVTGGNGLGGVGECSSEQTVVGAR